MSQLVSEKRTVAKAALPFNPRIQEQEWLARHQREYPGAWVALEGSVLLAVGPSLKEVRETAKRMGHERPLLHHIPEEFDVPFGGW
jgi:hypothetical protein